MGKIREGGLKLNVSTDNLGLYRYYTCTHPEWQNISDKGLYSSSYR